MSHQIKWENQKKISDYINEKVSYLQSIWDLQAAELLQKIHKIDERQKVNVDDKNPSSFFWECKTQWDIYLTKLRLIEDEISRRWTQSPTKEAPKPTQSPEKAPNKIPEMQNSLSRLWLNVKIWENGSLIWINGETNFTQKIWNRTFEVKENGNIFIQWAFGYEFQYENNIDGIEQYLEIADQIEYVDHMGLWHFGTNLKDMIEILNLYTSYTGLKYINVDDSSLNSTNFINQVELTNISKAFYKIWFLSTENFSYWFKNWEMQKVEFTHIMQTNFEWRNFLKWGSFDREMFKNVITETNWKK